MVARPARHDLDGPHPIEHAGRGKSEGVLDDAPGEHTTLQGVGHGPRLGEDLLLHVMPVAGLVRRVRGQARDRYRAFDALSMEVVDLDRLPAEIGDIALFQMDETLRHRQEREDVGGDEVLADPDADDERAAAPRGHQAAGLQRADDAERIGPFELGPGIQDGAQEVLALLEMEMDLVDRDLGVGLGGELVAEQPLARTQRRVILDDPVMDQRHNVVRYVGVGVAGARFPVRRPARVGDAGGAGKRMLCKRRFEHADLAEHPQPLQAAPAVDDRYPGRVVAAVLEPFQTLDEDRYDVALCYATDDAAHRSFPSNKARRSDTGVSDRLGHRDDTPDRRLAGAGTGHAVTWILAGLDRPAGYPARSPIALLDPLDRKERGLEEAIPERGRYIRGTRPSPAS